MASIQRFDPFNELVDDLFKGFLVRPLAYEGRGETLPRAKVDVAERNGAYVVTAELAGVKKEDIQVSIDGAQVTLAAEAKREREVAKASACCTASATSGKVDPRFRCGEESMRQGGSQVQRRHSRARRCPRRRPPRAADQIQ